MKAHSPILMGAAMFTANLALQAMTTADKGQIDIYRAIAIAILVSIVFFVVAPLFTARKVLPQSQSRIQLKSYPDASKEN